MRTIQSIASHSGNTRRLVGCLIAALFALALALPSAAVPIEFSGTFDDPTANDATPDNFTLLNPSSPTSQSYITQIVFDLSTAATGPVTFDEVDGAFSVTLEGGTGYTGYTLNGANNVLTISFTDFDPGESFNFTIDVDDNNGRINAERMAGSLVTATFFINGGTDLQAVMIDPAPAGGTNTTWSANTDVVVPEPASLPLIGLGLIGLAWHRRRASQR